MDYDIVIIGGGPAGLSFACSVAGLDLNILLVEKSSLESISKPKPDGREIALTHHSRKILIKLGVWALIDEAKVSLLKEAKVFDGGSDSLLNFDAKKSAIEALGYLVPNYLIRAALFERASQADNVTILNELMVDAVNTTNTGAEISLSNGKTIKSKLVVAADSRFSEIRRKMGIPSVMKDFSKVMITTRMSHEKAHNHVALECFNYGHTLALLPLNGNVSSIVLTVPTDRLDEMLDLDEEKFNAKSVMSLLQAGGILADKGYQKVVLEGSRQAINDVKILAQNNYCEEGEFPRQLSYLRPDQGND